MELDVATRAELSALRARAYGPHADITADPAALARLHELEDRLRPTSPPSGMLPGERGDSVRSESEDRDVVDSPAPPTDAGDAVAATRSRRTAWLVVAAAAVALLVAVVATDVLRTPDAAPPGVSDAAEQERPVDGPRFEFRVPTGAELLIRVPIDGSFGSYRELPESDVPLLPMLGEVRWAEPLGEYYGYDLWIGAVVATEGGEQFCVIASDATLQDGSCGSLRDWRDGSLVVSIPYPAIEPDERPDGLDPSESIRFWWTPDDTVYVVRGVAPPPADG